MHPSLLTLKILCVMWKQTHHDMKLVPQGVCHTIMRAELDSGSLRNKIEASHAAFLVLKWKQPVSTRRCSEEMWLAHRVISVSHIITSKQIKYDFIICTVYCRQLDFYEKWKQQDTKLLFTVTGSCYLFSWCHQVMCKCK